MKYGKINIPTLETERLILRPMTADDFTDYAAMRADPYVMHFVGGVMKPHEAWRAMGASIGQWALRGFGGFCVVEKATGAFAGHAGPLRPHGWPENEIGYTLTRAHHGKGYATEAARASLEFAYRELGWTTAISLIDPENHASQGVARKLGATLERQSVEVTDFSADIWRHQPPQQFLKQAN